MIDSDTKSMKITQQQMIIQSIFISLICLFIAILAIYIFDHKISNLITNFRTSLELQNDEIKAEKAIIEQIAYLDPLTNLLNRRAILSKLQESISRADRYKEYFSIALLDIDYFKAINDTYGHEAGDYILKELSDRIKANLRSDDAIARWGGEEFLILLNYTTPQVAYTKFNFLRDLIAKSKFNYEGKELELTLSLGVSSYVDESISLTELIKIADTNLYKAKNNGRNKVIQN